MTDDSFDPKRSIPSPRNELSPLSVIEILYQSPWQPSTVPGHPNLASWQSVLALLLRDVPIEPVAAALWPTLQTMAGQLIERAMEAVEHPDLRWGFYDWLASWRDQFSHWHDPIRALVIEHCDGPDAELLATHFPLLDGFAFCNFVLDAVLHDDERRAWRRAMDKRRTWLPSLPEPVYARDNQGQSSMARLCLYLYEHFQRHVKFPTAAAPASLLLKPYIASIYVNEAPLSPIGQVGI